MTIFALARMRRLALIELFLSTRPHWRRSGGDSVVMEGAHTMTREQLVAAIVATPAGKRLIGEAR